MNELEQIANEIQRDCHKQVFEVIQIASGLGKKIEYSDALNIFLFHKLAEFELRLRKLENSQSI